MKKFLVVLMILALCLTAVTACGKDESLDKAAEYVRSLYVGTDVTPADFDVVSKLKLDGEEYTVEFKDYSGNTISKVDALGDKVLNAAAIPDAPARHGYVFIGWSVDFSQPILDDVVATALYEKETVRDSRP